MRTSLLFMAAIVLLVAQGASARDSSYRAPRLPDGHPSLEGVWANTNLLPLERPKEFTSLAISADDAQKINLEEASIDNDLGRPDEPAEMMDPRQVRPIRGQLRSSMIVDPADGHIPGTEFFKQSQARARAFLLGAFDGPEQRPLSERCLVSPNSSPPVLLIPANDLRQIVQTRDTVIIASESLHDTRIIRMNSQHVPAAIVSWTGDSIGWWEKDTLVIETTQLMPSLVGRASPYGIYFVSPQTLVTERLTRISNEEILYAFSVADSTLYTKAWHGETLFTRSTDRIYPFDCHEGNYSLPNALQSERLKEAAASGR